MCKIKHLLLEICRWNLGVGCYCCWWVVACSWLALLLLVQLLALVLLLLNACLPFSSWDCCWLLSLLLQEWILSFRIYSMVLLDDVLVCLWCCAQELWCSCDGRVLVECVLCSLAELISSSCWNHCLAVVLTPPHSVSVTELLVSS
jgi:hypothetical protein